MSGSTQQSGRFAAVLWLLGQAVLTAAAAFAPGSAGLLALCLIVWPATAWIREKQGWTAFCLPVMTGAASMLLGGRFAAPMAVWCLGGVVALTLTCMPTPPLAHRPRWMREAAIYGGMALSALAAVIICLQRIFPGGIAAGVTAEIIAAIDASPNSAEMLYSLHEMGMMPLDASMTLVTEGADGLLYMTEEVRLQLLYGLHSRLEEAMGLSIPTWAVYLTALTVLMCVMLPVTVRRRRGEKDDTPRFERWQMPREIGLPLGCMFIGGLFPMITDAPVMMTMGQLMSALAGVIFSVMGAAVLRFASRRSGRGRMMTWTMILLAVVCVPQLLMFLGVIDQLMDIRKLRKTNESEEDRV